MIENRPPRGSHAPGAFYYYNNWDFNVAGTIFRQLTGPIFSPSSRRGSRSRSACRTSTPTNCADEYEREKSVHPAYEFRMSARDLARFGILIQHDGVWAGADHAGRLDRGEHDDVLRRRLDARRRRRLHVGDHPRRRRMSKLLGGTGVFSSGSASITSPSSTIAAGLVLRYDTDGTGRRRRPARAASCMRCSSPRGATRNESLSRAANAAPRPRRTGRSPSSRPGPGRARRRSLDQGQLEQIRLPARRAQSRHVDAAGHALAVVVETVPALLVTARRVARRRPGSAPAARARRARSARSGRPAPPRTRSRSSG